jgi:phospholipid transport system transporter-binding protein
MALSGALTVATIPQLLGQADALAGSGTLDLSAVTNADSAGVALLLELTRRARRQGRELAFAGAGAQVKRLVAFFELESALRFAD